MERFQLSSVLSYQLPSSRAITGSSRPGSSGARIMASFLQRMASQGCVGGSFLRQSGRQRAALSYYRKGGTTPVVESDEDLQPNWR